MGPLMATPLWCLLQAPLHGGNLMVHPPRLMAPRFMTCCVALRCVFKSLQSHPGPMPTNRQLVVRPGGHCATCPHPRGRTPRPVLHRLFRTLERQRELCRGRWGARRVEPNDANAGVHAGVVMNGPAQRRRDLRRRLGTAEGRAVQCGGALPGGGGAPGRCRGRCCRVRGRYGPVLGRCCPGTGASPPPRPRLPFPPRAPQESSVGTGGGGGFAGPAPQDRTSTACSADTATSTAARYWSTHYAASVGGGLTSLPLAWGVNAGSGWAARGGLHSAEGVLAYHADR